MGVTVQGEHDGPEEDRSDPEGRGAHGPARPDVWSSGEEEHERTRPGRSRRELVGRARGLRGRAVPPSWQHRRQSSGTACDVGNACRGLDVSEDA